MKIQAIVSIQTKDKLFAPGDIFDVSKEDGEALIAAGAARQVEKPPRGSKGE